VLEVNSMAALGAGASFVLAAKTAGYDFSQLVNRILDVAYRRCFGAAPMPVDTKRNMLTLEGAVNIHPEGIAIDGVCRAFAEDRIR